MKLHLPRTLFAALLACFSLHAQGDVLASDAIKLPPQQTSRPIHSVPAPGTETPTTIDLDTWTYDMSGIPVDANLTCSKNFAIEEFSWEASPGAVLTWQGLVSSKAGDFVTVADKNISFSVTGEGKATFLIDDVYIRGGTLVVEEGADVRIDYGTPVSSAKGTLYLNGGSMRGHGSFESIYYNGGSNDGLSHTLICMCARPTGGSSMLDNYLALYPHFTVQFEFWKDDNTGVWTCAPLNVSGYIHMGRDYDGTINCLPEGGSWGEDAELSSPCVLFSCGNLTLSGNGFADLKLQLNGLDPAKYSLNKTIYGGQIAIYLGQAPTVISVPIEGRSTGLIIGNRDGNIWSDQKLIEGTGHSYTTGTIASGITDVAEGTTVEFTDALAIGQDTAPADGEPAAAVNNAGNITARSISITNASVLNDGSIFTADGVLIGSRGVLRSDGTITGSVEVEDGGAAQGSLDINGRLLMHSGARLTIGNSPGYARFGSGLTLEGGSSLVFTVDGTTPASRGAETEGTHSFAHITGGSLTLSGEVLTTVQVTSGILEAGSQPFTLTLLKVEGGGANVDAGNGGFTFSLLDDAEGLLLAEETYLVWDAEKGELLLHGVVDTGEEESGEDTPGGEEPGEVVQRQAVNASALVNTLWSSTSAVRTFARHASSQLSSPAGENGVSVWGSALSDFVSMSGLRSHAFGYAVGADKQFCPHVRAGLALGQMFGDYTAESGLAEVEQNSMMLGLYGEYARKLNQRLGLSVTGSAAYGRVENDANTRLPGSAPGKASWDDDVFTAGFRVNANVQLAEKWTLSPFIGLEYLRGEQGRFTEHVADGSREYWGGAMQVWTVPVGVTASTECDLGGGQKLLPWLTVGYVGDVSREEPHGSVRAHGVESRHEGTRPGRHGFMLSAGTNWQISDSWSAGASYNLETRSHATLHEGHFSLRYAF